MRAAGEDGFLSPAVLPVERSVDVLVAQLQDAAIDALGGMTLRDLAAHATEAASPEPGVAPLGALADPVWIEAHDNTAASKDPRRA